jgi:site-specific DNA recombinase
MDQGESYIPPFVRKLMCDASEPEIVQAAENLRAYLSVLYRVYLDRKRELRTANSAAEQPHGRFTPRQRAAAQTMNRYVGYIRVSTAKQGQLGSSLQEQRDAIVAFAGRHGLEISDWYEDRETAAKRGRTQFVRMMAFLEKGKAKGVVLHKIDRGARNLWDWARLQDLLEAGIEVRFAHEDLDLRSRGGRLAADIQAVVAADYVRNLREEVRKGMRGRLKQGLYPLRAPVGYLDQGKGKPKTIDPVKGPLVRVAFELYASSFYSYDTLARELHRRGLRRPSGKPLTLNGISTMLRNPFYTGIILVKSTGETFQGIHEPLVSAATFRAVQNIIDGKRNVAVRRNDFIYRRMLRCGACGQILTGERQKGRVYYRCHTRGCATTGIREDRVVASLGQAASKLSFSEQQIEEMEPQFERLDAQWKSEREKELAALKLQLAAITDREVRLTDAFVDKVLERESYVERKAKLLLERAEVMEKVKDSQLELADGSQRLRGYFELVRTFNVGVVSNSLLDYRETIETLTSNRTLVGKKLDVAMRSPFREIIRDLGLTSSEPYREEFRTSPTKNTPARESPSSYLNAKRTQILRKHLKKWQPPKSIVEALKPKRKPLPQWFKPKEPPQAQDHD